MAVPTKLSTIAGGAAATSTWANLVKALTDWLLEDAPLFKGQAHGDDGAGGTDDAVPSATVTTFGFGADGNYYTTPLINVGFDDPDFADPDPEPVPLPETGKYEAILYCQWPSHATGYRYVGLLGGGTGASVADRRPAVSGAVTQQTAVGVIDRTAGDTLDVELYQNSTTTLTPTVYLTLIMLRST